MINKLYKSLFVFSAVFALYGCSTYQDPYKTLLIENESTVIRGAYLAVDYLIGKNPQATSSYLTPNISSGVLVSTIVDINDLNKSSPFGRLLSEQISSRISQHGFVVNELKLRGNLYVDKSQGELILSREVKDISTTQNAAYVITGTYAEAEESVYVTLKLVRASDSRVLNAFNFNMAKTSSVRGLLRNER
jgi:TolB-like protein